MHPERIIQNYKKFNNGLNYDGVGFPVREKDFSKIETKNNVYINVFRYENRLTFPIYISNQKFENSMYLLLITDENKSHYVYFCFTKQKVKTKSTFARVVYSVLVVEKY